jgi:iron complex outermembrane receptor protein
MQKGHRLNRPSRVIPGTRGLALLVAAYCVFVSSAAEAQRAAPEQVPDSPSTQNYLEDIIVTARRRPEPLQRVPVSVVALSKEDLESRSVTNLRTLQNFVPNVTFAPSQNVGEAAANVFIRGIGQEDFGVGAEGGVAFYVDGVYLPRSLGLLMNLTDVDRVEVLRGPQGTLYGKDSIGGAINVISTMPGADRERRAEVILGNYQRVELRTILNEPLSRRLFLRAALGLVNRAGYLRRLAPPAPIALVEDANGRSIDLHSEGDDRGQGGRLQLRWLISDTLTADVSLDASRKRDRQGAIHIDLIDPRFGDIGLLNALILQGKLPGPQITNALAPGDLLESYAAGRNFTDQEFWGASITLTQQLGANTLKFIGAFRGLHSHVGTDDDGLYFDLGGNDLEVRQHQLSGELQFNGVARKLTYTAGLFAFGERPKLLPWTSITNVFYTCGCAPDHVPPLTSEPRQLRVANLSGYAQGTYKLSDRLSATFGARYAHEKKTLYGKSFLLDADLKLTNVVLATGAARHSWNSLTYRADLQYRLTPDLMAYGSLARGYKSGGFNVRGEAGLPNMGFVSFDPETALTYEIGLRSEWLNRRLRLNATLFDSEYHDIQLRQQTIIAGEFTTLIENAARARIRGAEVELIAAPAEGLTITAAYGHLAPRYLDVGQVRGLTLDSSFQRSPRHSFTGSINYELPLRSGIVELHGDYSYRSKEQFQIVAAGNDQKGYGLVGARLTYRARDDRWSVALFGTNLTDKRYRTAGRGTLLQQVGFAYSSIGLPRQIGLQVNRRF